MQNSYHAQFIPLDLSGNGLEAFGGSLVFWSPTTGLAFGQQSMPFSRPHSCMCTVPCCAYLQDPEQSFCPRKLLPYPHMAPFSSHILLLLTACYYQGSLVGRTAIWLFVFETDISPLSSGLLLLYFHSTEASLASVRKGGWNIFIINGYEGLKREKVKRNNWPANHILRKPIL